MRMILLKPLPRMLLAMLLAGALLCLMLHPWQINIAVDCYTVSIGLAFVYLAIRRNSIQDAVDHDNPHSEHLMVVGIAGVLFATVLIRGYRLIVWSLGTPVPIDTYGFALISLVQLFGFCLLLVAVHNTSAPLADRAIRALTYAFLGGSILAFTVFGAFYLELIHG